MNKTWFLPSTVSNVEERLTARWQELLSAVTKMYKTVFIVFILVGWKLSAHGLAASCGRLTYKELKEKEDKSTGMGGFLQKARTVSGSSQETNHISDLNRKKL